MKQLMHTFVISRLDYCNSILASLPQCLLSLLQRVQNARLVLGLQLCDHMVGWLEFNVPFQHKYGYIRDECDHIRPALSELHWLPVHLCTEYKLCLLVHTATVQCCPSYNSDLPVLQATAHLQGLHSSADTLTYTVPLTVTKFSVLFQLQGALYHLTFDTSQTILLLNVI